MMVEERSMFGLLREQFEQSEILHDLGSRRGPLYLDDHSLAILERRPVYLGDSAGRQRRGVDLLENVLPGDA